jgi:hypothetical protein
MTRHTKYGVKNKKNYHALVILIIAVIFFAVYTSGFLTKNSAGNNPAPQKLLWQYQCIDTMKTSRDKARIWKQQPDLHADIDQQLTKIKQTGANCVAIDTPYDPEFLPYLRLWVTKARKHQLSIWFRGNFSSWEGWFEYPKTMTSQTLFSKTRQFISDHPDLFQDGDIFTAAPEAENGGEFNQVEIDEYEDYRKFLVGEYNLLAKSFQKINKKVDVRWMSMNGGLAKRMLDQPTINRLGKTVTIDHYIKAPEEMSDYIKYFAQKYNARLVIGEFGAPIPEINGSMTQDQQADFTDQLLREMYRHREKIIGLNYWVLYDSSTALLNQDGSERKAYHVIKKYFTPITIHGKITNEFNQPLAKVSISSSDNIAHTVSDNQGNYVLTLPDQTAAIKYLLPDYQTQKITLSQSTRADITLRETSPSLFEKIQLWFYNTLHPNPA